MAPRDVEDKSEEGSISTSDFGDNIDLLTFEQILEMDDDDEHEFSSSIVFGFFEQAEMTFVKMDKALDERDLPELSQLGHFLKGSSATLGLTKVKDSCEKIQNYGNRLDEAGQRQDMDPDECLRLIKDTLVTAKEDYKEAEGLLRRFFASEST